MVRYQEFGLASSECAKYRMFERMATLTSVPDAPWEISGPLKVGISSCPGAAVIRMSVPWSNHITPLLKPITSMFSGLCRLV